MMKEIEPGSLGNGVAEDWLRLAQLDALVKPETGGIWSRLASD